MEGLPGRVISPMPGPPPRQHKHERQLHTKHTLSHPNKANMEGWLRRPNDIRGPWGPKDSRHLSYCWGKTPKKPHPGNLSRPGIEPGPAAWQVCMLPLAPQRWTDPFIWYYNTGIILKRIVTELFILIFFLFMLHGKSVNPIMSSEVSRVSVVQLHRCPSPSFQSRHVIACIFSGITTYLVFQIFPDIVIIWNLYLLCLL